MARGQAEDRFERALALATAYRHAEAERELRHILRLVENGGPSTGLTRERVLLTLAAIRAERGHVDEGLAILDGLAETGPLAVQGLVLSQRGLLRLRSGDLPAALADLQIAVPMLDSDAEGLVVALLNRGLLHMTTGDLGAAREDFGRCSEVAGTTGQPLYESRARHNLAYLEFVAGDLPTALAGMDRAYREHSGTSSASDGVYHLDRARVLFAAGLLAEADADLVQASVAFAGAGARQYRVESELARAHIALTEGRPRDALRLGRQARSQLAAGGSQGWSLVADLAVVRARRALGRGLAAVAADAARLAVDLRAARLYEDARTALLVAVDARLGAGDLDGAVAAAGRMRGLQAGDGILTRLYAREVRADLAMSNGSPRAAAAELTAGLRELHGYQGSFGSLDLQTAVMRHGLPLVSRGLTLAVASGRPERIFSWVERSRALASHLPPVRPPDDPEAAKLLEQLRYVRTELRAVELEGRDEPVLRARRHELERRVRQRSWHVRGVGDVGEPARLSQLRAELAEAPGGPGTLVAHLVVDGRVLMLVVGTRRARFVRAGNADALLETVRRVRADLDVLALGGIPVPMRDTASRSLVSGLQTLDRELLGPVAGRLGTGPLVLVPAGVFVGVPWTMLPTVRGRPMSVARSATSWLRAGRPRSMTGPGSTALFAAGPGLARAAEEVAHAAALWPHATVLTGSRATGPALIEAVPAGGVVHVAAHGVHEAANPLFSAVRLADGPLFGYDLVRVKTLPEHVVLSACDLGLATQRAGDELLGLTAALLRAGIRSVVASVARVADDVACDVTVDYHRGLRAGLTPSQALATVTADRWDAPFVCFGRGW